MPEPITPPAVTPPAPTTPPPSIDFEAKFKELEAKLAALTPREVPDLNGKAKQQNDDLIEKARLQRESQDKVQNDTKLLEDALKFNLSSQDFLKKNESVLPKDISNIFELAEKENYSNAIEKVDAIKSGMIQSFFSVQANVDFLTPSMKSQLDDYLKLTKNGKQEKARDVYNNIFEPAFEMLKRIKKAEALSKGYADHTDGDEAYKNRLMKLSKTHYFGKE